MFFPVRKIVILLIAVSHFAYANEPEHGEGGGEKAAAPKEVKSKEESFGVVQARVQALEAKVRSGQDEIKKLIQEKQHTKDQKRVSEIIKQMMTVHREMEKNAKEYDQQRALLNYRYPEKGQSEKRKYERIEVKSIEEMEGQMSLSTTVKKTMKKVRSQYGIPEKNESISEGSAPGEHGSSGGHKQPQPGLTDPVILKK